MKKTALACLFFSCAAFGATGNSVNPKFSPAATAFDMPIPGPGPEVPMVFDMPIPGPGPEVPMVFDMPIPGPGPEVPMVR